MKNINNCINLKSYAKINLYLNIIKRLESGYHNIETIFQTISLYDSICIKKVDQPVIKISCNNPEIPVGEDSLIFRTIKSLVINKSIGLEIFIDKRIPLASGLGGGSSNVATILLGICRLFNIKISPSSLAEIAESLGMDVPYFLKRGTVYATGKGEKLFPLKEITPPLHLILVNPGMKISTAWAYEMYDRKFNANKSDHSSRIEEYLERDKRIKLENIHDVVYNCFEFTIGNKCPVIKNIRNQLIELGAIAVSLSGSGPTVFGIFINHKMVEKAYIKIKNKYPFVEKVKTLSAKNV